MGAALFQEAEAARRQVHAASTTTMGIGVRMRRVAIAGVALTVVLAFVLPAVIRALLAA
jgi:hypothetical protein